TAVAEMDKVTQQNASNSEESASAAEELNSQAEELNSMVSEFTLTGTGRPQGSMGKATGPAGKSHHFEAPAAVKGLRNRVHSMVSHGGETQSGAGNGKKQGDGRRKSKPEDIIRLDDDDFSDF
ncbi:MAG: hypothetical protein JW902_11945, partial [Syntrophaceae bacterium]|nr:hypothetical protein [Syntrophaceae bacterium]